MKISSHASPFLIAIISIFGFSFGMISPVSAEVVCENGTIINHTNGQLHDCILARNVRVNASINNVSLGVFPCKAKNHIFFNDKGIFSSCQLSENIQIQTGNSIKVCPVNYGVFVSDNNNLSVDCRYLSSR
jgi:hypothetical protein